MKRWLKSSKGFTLMELLVVVAILGVLMAIVAPAVTGTKSTSQEGQVKSDGKGVQTATDTFNNKSIKTGKFPEEALRANGAGDATTQTSTTPGYVTQYQIASAVRTTDFGDDDVKLILRDGTVEDLHSELDVRGKFATINSVANTQVLTPKRRFLDFTAETESYDTDGSVKKAIFTPDFLSKEPESTPLKGDETKDLGNSLNNYPEYLWVLLVNAPGSEQESRNVQVFRLIRAYCTTAPSISGTVIVSDTTPPQPTSAQACSTPASQVAAVVYKQLF